MEFAVSARTGIDPPWISVQGEVLAVYAELLGLRESWADARPGMHRDAALERIDQQIEVCWGAFSRWAREYVAPELPREARR